MFSGNSNYSESFTLQCIVLQTFENFYVLMNSFKLFIYILNYLPFDERSFQVTATIRNIPLAQ